MNRPVLRRTAACVGLTALGAAGLAGVPTSASAAVAYGEVGGSFYATAYVPSGQTYTCGRSGTADGAHSGEWSDNGVPVAQALDTSTTFTRSNAAADKVVVQSAGTASVSATPVTGGTSPATITGSASVSISATPALPSTGCDVSSRVERGADGGFILTQPMWATISGSGDGTGNGTIEVWDENSSTRVELGARGSGSSTMLLMPGEAGVSFEVEARAYGSIVGERAKAYAASFRVELQPVGAAGAVSGKDAGYVQFGARDCATGNVTAVVTKKARKKARAVLIRSNGTKVAQLKGRKLKPKTLVLPADRGAAATASAKVVRKNGKKATVTRTYLPCA